jgi:hypothetical protein
MVEGNQKFNTPSLKRVLRGLGVLHRENMARLVKSNRNGRIQKIRR